MDINLIEIDKTIAARNLLYDAILLFYEKRSPISIHLAHAAHEVLCAITGDSHLFDSSALTAEGKKEFKCMFNISKNFIKHADKDPNATLKFNTQMNVFLLLDCAWIINLKIDEACVYSQTFIAWCAFIYPELFNSEYINRLVIPVFDFHDFEAIAADLKLHYVKV